MINMGEGAVFEPHCILILKKYRRFSTWSILIVKKDSHHLRIRTKESKLC